MTNDKPLSILASEFPELYNWVKSISRCGKIEDFIMPDYRDKRMSVKFFTKNYEYRVSARLSRATNEHSVETDKDGKIVGESNAPMDNGYLGCTVQVRKPRAGEDWQRGSDLPDGKYCEETWQRIVNAIIAYEIVKFIKPKEYLKENIPVLKNI